MKLFLSLCWAAAASPASPLLVHATTPVSGNSNRALVAGCENPTDLLEVAAQWNLGNAFKECFERVEMDGDALVHSPKIALMEACPDVPALQWDRLFRRIQVQEVPIVQAPVVPARRNLAEEDGGGSGLHLVSNNSKIIFGESQSSYSLMRTDTGLSVQAPSLSLSGDVSWEGNSPLDANLTALAQRISDLEAGLEKTSAMAQECSLQFQARACMSSIDQLHDQSHFYSSYTGTIHGCMLVYHSGFVDCSTGDGNSNWGCHDTSTSLGTFILDATDTEPVFPAEGTFTWSGSSGAWYATDDDLGWWPSAAYLYFPGETEVSAGDGFHLQYGEAWQQYTTSDNSGTTCADIYWKVGDCDIQNTGRE